MESQIENLILEHFERFQSGQELIERELKEIKGRISQIEVLLPSGSGSLNAWRNGYSQAASSSGTSAVTASAYRR